MQSSRASACRCDRSKNRELLRKTRAALTRTKRIQGKKRGRQTRAASPHKDTENDCTQRCNYAPRPHDVPPSWMSNCYPNGRFSWTAHFTTPNPDRKLICGASEQADSLRHHREGQSPKKLIYCCM
jgi:hypothetical protein